MLLGLKTKLVEGNDYKLSIKVPRGVKKSVDFTATSETTNLYITTANGNKLPLGDVFPLGDGDGTINSLDKAELNREWISSVAGTGRAADLNGDGRVNSFDWACMKADFGANNDNF